MSRILMLTHTILFKEGIAFGPAIRLLEIAKALKKRGHDITICEINRKNEIIIDSIPIRGFNSMILVDINKKFDIAFLQIWFSDTKILEKLSKIPIIVDIYAPYLIEHIYWKDYLTKTPIYGFNDDIWTQTLIPFKYGDYFICASERQKKYYLGLLSACGRINPFNSDKKLIGIVPYGVRDGGPVGRKTILKKRIPQDKKIILWLSAFYPWLTPLKSAEIIYELTKLRNDYVLAIVGAKSPFSTKFLSEESYNNFMTYAKDKNMIDKSIFMFDWVNYDDVESLYNESNLFITTFEPDSLETEFSYRVRMTDALWGRLPIISSGGDVISEIIDSRKMGIVSNDAAKDIARNIANLSKNDINIMKRNIEEYLETVRWDEVIDPIDNFCNAPFIDKSKKDFTFNSLIKNRRQNIIDLRKEYSKKQEEVEEKNGLIKDLSGEIYSIIDQNERKIELINRLLNDRDKEVNELRYIIETQKVSIGKFRNSIVYPFYRFTSTIGQTKLGNFLQRVLK